jgi:hypothetical protein
MIRDLGESGTLEHSEPSTGGRFQKSQTCRHRANYVMVTNIPELQLFRDAHTTML